MLVLNNNSVSFEYFFVKTYNVSQMAFPSKLTRDSIVEAGLVALEQEGIEGLNLRNFAARLNVKAPSLYRHFTDKESLLLELATRAKNIQLERFSKIPRSKDFAETTLVEVGKAYVDFALEQPALYDLLMSPRITGDGKVGKDLWQAVLGYVGDVTANPDDTPAAVAVWSFLHGYVHLARSGMFGESGPKGGLEVGLEAMVRGLSATA